MLFNQENNIFMDDNKKIIYEKELKNIYFELNPDNSYISFLDLLIEYINNGYSIKDQREFETKNFKDILTPNLELLKISDEDIELREELKKEFKRFVFYNCCIEKNIVIEKKAYAEFKDNYSSKCDRQIYYDVLAEFLKHGYEVQFERTGTIQAIQ